MQQQQQQQDQEPTTKELDLEAIEATLDLMPRLGRFPAYFYDMRSLVAEVKRLRAIVGEPPCKCARCKATVKTEAAEIESEIEGVPV